MNRSALVTHVENLLLEARAFAFFADQFDVGQKLHFLYLDAVALAAFATAAGHIEGEVRRIEPVRLRFACRREHFANRVVDFDVGDRIRARRASDRRLIDQHHVIEKLRAFDFSETRRRGPATRRAASSCRRR